MFNLFNSSKDENKPAIDQESLPPNVEHQVENDNEDKGKPVHGEDGACCGGCGGQ
ncbi:CCGSCS motif protein [Thalassotalea marina]|uniref:CCGSCS motif protein n=1 Tax=Thalassotalea marina TaxID=1673741 RepID=A0A919BB70_9GAMM|nr:CCGSCS motif protein [Thalassotalea marina]GHF79031.1 hypothetical protein GCM10017161_02720 [Thalassotalea marina]